jgi:hemerythrin superfamily protein
MAIRKIEPIGFNGTDAIVALTADHSRVKVLFREYSAVRDRGVQNGSEKADLVRKICTELKIHTEIEEEIFYPAVRAQIGDDELMNEALVEHAGAKRLIEELEGMEPDDDLYDTRVTVLGEEIDHHALEEETEMFPRAKKAKVDTVALGERMARRKSALKSELNAPAEATHRRLRAASPA